MSRKRYTAEQIIGHLRQAEIRTSEGKTDFRRLGDPAWIPVSGRECRQAPCPTAGERSDCLLSVSADLHHSDVWLGGVSLNEP